MRLLEVGGDGDYLALTFENHFGPDLTHVWEQAWQRTHHNETYKFADKTGRVVEIEVFAYEFAAVDPAFVDFIRSEFLDYDDTKHHNFYIIENPQKTNKGKTNDHPHLQPGN